MRFTLPALGSVLLFAGWTYAADCAQPRDGASEADGQQLADIIYHNDWLRSLCAPRWPEGGNEVSRARGHVHVKITSEDTSKDLAHCQEGLDDIINQCILPGTNWGGSWSSDGETYLIYNDQEADSPDDPTTQTPGDDGATTQVPDDTGPTTQVSDDPGPITSAPAGATVVTEVIDGTTQIATFTPSSATEPVTTSTRDDSGALVVVVVPIGGLIWAIFGAAPGAVPVAPPPVLPTPTAAPPPDGDPDDDDDDSCTTTTVDSCVQTCSEVVVEQEQTSTSCDEPTCTDLAACDATATTSTVTASSSAEPSILISDEQIHVIELPQFDFQWVLDNEDTITADMRADGGDPSTQPSVPISELPCSDNSANEIPSQVPVNGETKSINDVVYLMRMQLCASTCSAPEGIDALYVATYPGDDQADECEIAVGITDQVEAWCYRGTRSDDDGGKGQRQDCFDATETIIEKCIRNGPNKGWWNGDEAGQFYECGMRPLNGGDGKHEADITDWLASAPASTMDAQPSPADPTPSSPGDDTPPAQATETVYPTHFDGQGDCVDAGEGVGTDTTGLFWVEGSMVVLGERLGPGVKLSTSDKSKCVRSGQAKNDAGAILHEWCVAHQEGDAAFVIADKYKDWGNGATGNSEITGEQFMDFTKWTTNECGGTGKATAGMGGAFSQGQSLNSICIVHKDHPESCGINWGVQG